MQLRCGAAYVCDVACYYPLTGYRARTVNHNGNRPVVFNKREGYEDRPVTVTCGRCIGCRLDRSRQWAVRAMHEAQMWPENCFVTLTYDDKWLPETGSLEPREHQLFLKRLRAKYRGKTIRFFHCGEYGEVNNRPHYHTLLFNHDFSDKQLLKSTPAGDRIYTSETLAQLWPFGFSTIGAVTFESAAYVARYAVKKVTGEAAKGHYLSLNNVTGEINEIQPEYTTSSNRPALGAPWFAKYKEEVYPDDFVVSRGMKVKPPRHYDELLKRESAELFEQMKSDRRKTARRNAEHETYDRLRAREEVTRAKLSMKRRSL